MTGLGVYETPRWAIDAMLTRVTMLGNTILEPCAGSGAIVQAVRARDPGAHITAVEIRPEEEDALHCAGADEIHIADFLTWEAPRCFWDGSRHQSIEWLAPESDFKAGV